MYMDLLDLKIFTGSTKCQDTMSKMSRTLSTLKAAEF